MDLVTISDTSGIRTLVLNNPPANTLNMNSMQALLKAFVATEKDKSVRGIVLSGRYPFFSAGLDLKELGILDRPAFSQFIKLFYDLVYSILKTSKPVIACINGHSPAGGCVLALCCDYRIMVQGEKFKIGLNEIPMGIMVPPSIQELYISAIGYRLAYQYLLEGRLHSAQEALKIGLVDAVIPRENLEHACTEKMHHYLQADSETFGCAKQNMRLMLLKRMQDADSMAVESIENHFWKPSSQSRLQTILKGLSKSN